MSHYFKFKQDGFIILIVLIFMQVLILLNWYAIEDFLLLMKSRKNVASREAIFHQAEIILYRAESGLIAHLPACMIPLTDSETFILKSLSWWQSQSCSGNSGIFKYYYVVERRAIDACAIVDPIEKTIANYFRITLFLYLKDGARIFLQSDIVTPSDNVVPQTCEGTQHIVQAGRQSWRELN